jgi:hypothetical protein
MHPGQSSRILIFWQQLLQEHIHPVDDLSPFKCFTLPCVYTWISNQLIHCVNLSVTWWPKTFNHECSTIRPVQQCALHGIKGNSISWYLSLWSLSRPQYLWRTILPELFFLPYLFCSWTKTLKKIIVGLWWSLGIAVTPSLFSYPGISRSRFL